MRHLALLLTLSAILGAAEPPKAENEGAQPTKTPPAIEMDTVFLTNGHRLTGYVEEESEATVTIRTDSGYMTLPADLVAHVERSIEKAASTIKGDDYEATMKLVRRALLERRKTEALKLLEKAVVMPGADGRSVQLLGAVLDDIGGSGARVRELYTRYRDEFKGTDKGTLDRLKELDTLFVDYERKLAEIEEQVKGVKIVEGYEARIGWRPENPQHFNKGTPKIIKNPNRKAVEDKILRIEYSGGDRYKTSIRRRISNDLSGVKTLRLYASKPDKGDVHLSVAFKSGDKWVYHESVVQKLPGDGKWHKIQFDLQAATFKSAATKWNHTATLSDPHDVRELHIQVHNGKKDGVVFIDAMNFVSM